jgi:hypothetical protein
MKTRKHFNVMALFAIIAILALSMTGCEPEDDKPEPTDNQSVPYGTLPNGVGIYKGDASITDAQMATAVQNAIAGYNSAVAAGDYPNGKFTKLVILGHDKIYTWDGNVLGIGIEAGPEYFQGRFTRIANGTLQFAHARVTVTNIC